MVLGRQECDDDIDDADEADEERNRGLCGEAGLAADMAPVANADGRSVE